MSSLFLETGLRPASDWSQMPLAVLPICILDVDILSRHVQKAGGKHPSVCKKECRSLSGISVRLANRSMNSAGTKARLGVDWTLIFCKDERPRSLGGFSRKWNNIGRLEVDEIPNLIIRSFLVGVVDAGADFANQAEAEELHA